MTSSSTCVWGVLFVCVWGRRWRVWRGLWKANQLKGSGRASQQAAAASATQSRTWTTTPQHTQTHTTTHLLAAPVARLRGGHDARRAAAGARGHGRRVEHAARQVLPGAGLDCGWQAAVRGLHYDVLLCASWTSRQRQEPTTASDFKHSHTQILMYPPGFHRQRLAAQQLPSSQP